MSLLNKASLIQIPSGYKDGTLYSAKPTNGDGDFTFSRGSNLGATRVNSEGLIEKGRENLLLQSNSFDTTWTNVNTSETSGQSGYDGTNDAWLLSKTAQSARIEQTISTSGVQTFSIYAKAGTLNWIRLNVYTAWAYYDLNNGVVGTDTNDIIQHNIYDVGNGWYRCELVINLSANILRIYPAEGDGDVSGTSGNILIQDSQLESGLVSTDVITTTTTTAQAGILEDMPRLDYSGGATCGSLLLEPQRSNLLAYSEYYAAGQWANTDVRLTTNHALSPEGKMNASLWEFTTTNTLARIQYVLGGVTVGATYTQSYYIKSLSGDLTLRIGTSGAVSGEFEDITATSEWQRFVFTGVASTTTEYPRIQNISGTQGAQILVYGAQMEAGSYPTSYIPTYGASVTRGAESLAISGMSNNLASGVSSTTLFMDFEFQKEVTADTLTFRNSTSALGRGYLYDVRMGMADSYGINITLTENTQQKCIWRLNTLSNATVFANGTKGNTSNGNTWSDVDTIDLFGSRWSMKIKQITLFNSALTDAECIQLTTI